MGDSDINITVKFNGRPIPITVSHDSTIQHVKAVLLTLTNVPPEGQKLIFKGGLLENGMTLKDAGVMNGAKLMLVGTQGLHLGDDPILNETKEVQLDEDCMDRWEATGIVELAEHNLKAIPEEVWLCSRFIRVLDLSHNSIQRVPFQLGNLIGLKKLSLNANGLTDETVNWSELLTLNHLTFLSLNQNCLKILPFLVGHMSNLQQLHLANNMITTFPDTIGMMTSLEVLKANNNRINSIPTTIGHCTSLVEVDLSSNDLTELQPRFCSLINLKALYLGNNPLSDIPFSLLADCPQLSTFEVHDTEITMDVLRQFKGWEDFEKRRREKQFSVLNSAEFDEGADKS